MPHRSLRTALVLLSLVPIATGLLGAVGGPPYGPDPQDVNPSIDSEFRFTAVFWLAAGVVLLWSTFDLPARVAATRIPLALAALGGLARLWSVVVTDWPHPVFIAALILELAVVPIVLIWHARVMRGTRRARDSSSAQVGPDDQRPGLP